MPLKRNGTTIVPFWGAQGEKHIGGSKISCGKLPKLTVKDTLSGVSPEKANKLADVYNKSSAGEERLFDVPRGSILEFHSLKTDSSGAVLPSEDSRVSILDYVDVK